MLDEDPFRTLAAGIGCLRMSVRKARQLLASRPAPASWIPRASRSKWYAAGRPDLPDGFPAVRRLHTEFGSLAVTISPGPVAEVRTVPDTPLVRWEPEGPAEVDLAFTWNRGVVSAVRPDNPQAYGLACQIAEAMEARFVSELGAATAAQARAEVLSRKTDDEIRQLNGDREREVIAYMEDQIRAAEEHFEALRTAAREEKAGPAP